MIRLITFANIPNWPNFPCLVPLSIGIPEVISPNEPPPFSEQPSPSNDNFAQPIWYDAAMRIIPVYADTVPSIVQYLM